MVTQEYHAPKSSIFILRISFPVHPPNKATFKTSASSAYITAACFVVSSFGTRFCFTASVRNDRAGDNNGLSRIADNLHQSGACLCLINMHRKMAEQIILQAKSSIFTIIYRFVKLYLLCKRLLPVSVFQHFRIG